MRHAFLDMNVSYMSIKFYCWGLSIEKDVLAEKIKVKNSVFISQLLSLTKDIILPIINK